MNIAKVIDRIAILMAILAAFPGGILGLGFAYSMFGEVHHQADISLVWWKVLIYIFGSVLGAGASFFVVWFGIRGATSGIRKLYRIIAGHKGEPKEGD